MTTIIHFIQFFYYLTLFAYLIQLDHMLKFMSTYLVTQYKLNLIHKVYVLYRLH